MNAEVSRAIAMKTETSPAPQKGRKCAEPPNEIRAYSRLSRFVDHHYEYALQATGVKAALLAHEVAQFWRDSISRKLCGGSTCVTVDDLARWEATLSDAKNSLAQIAHQSPILEQHPVFASVVAHS